MFFRCWVLEVFDEDLGCINGRFARGGLSDFCVFGVTLTILVILSLIYLCYILSYICNVPLVVTCNIHLCRSYPMIFFVMGFCVKLILYLVGAVVFCWISMFLLKIYRLVIWYCGIISVLSLGRFLPNHCKYTIDSWVSFHRSCIIPKYNYFPDTNGTLGHIFPVEM